MRYYIVGMSLFLAACGAEPEKQNDAQEDNRANEQAGQTATSSEECSLPTVSGKVTGHLYYAGSQSIRSELDEEIDLDAFACTTVHSRDGTPAGTRLAFGEYSIPWQRPVAPSLVMFDDHIVYRKGEERWRIAGILEVDGNTGTWRNRGSDLVSLQFECDQSIDPDSAQSVAEIPLDIPPGSAVVHRAQHDHIAYMLDGLECDLSRNGALKLRRQDLGGTCDFSKFELRPKSSNQPVLGPGTYPDYFHENSPLVTTFFDRDLDLDVGPGTLDIVAENPYRGFVTFTSQWRQPERIEFHCAE